MSNCFQSINRLSLWSFVPSFTKKGKCHSNPKILRKQIHILFFVHIHRARDIYSPKVLVIPRNRWLRLNMTEKLFTGTLNKNQNKYIVRRFHYILCSEFIDSPFLIVVPHLSIITSIPETITSEGNLVIQRHSNNFKTIKVSTT